MENDALVGFVMVGLALLVLIVLVVWSKCTIDRIHSKKIKSLREFFKETDES